MKLLIALYVCLPFSIHAQSTSTISGAVSYFFNDNSGNKPDIGANVYILKFPGNLPLYDTLDRYKEVKEFRQLIKSAAEWAEKCTQLAKRYKKKKKDKDKFDRYNTEVGIAVKDEHDFNTRLKTMGIQSESDFDSLDKHTNIAVSVLKYSSILKTTVDTVGNFNLKVKPGRYFILFESNYRTYTSVTESMGQIKYIMVDVDDGETKNVAATFDIDFRYNNPAKPFPPVGDIK